MTLKDAANAVVGTTTTDANGAYGFNNLPAGAYTVVVTAPANYAQTCDPDWTKDSKTAVTLTSGQGRHRSELRLHGHSAWSVVGQDGSGHREGG